MDIFLSPIVFPIAIVAFILLMLLIIFVTKYQTAKPDEALIISGSYLGNKNVHADESNNKIKIVRGGGSLCFASVPTIKPNQLTFQQAGCFNTRSIYGTRSSRYV